MAEEEWVGGWIILATTSSTGSFVLNQVYFAQLCPHALWFLLLMAVLLFLMYYSLRSPFHQTCLYLCKPLILFMAPESFPIEFLGYRPIMKWRMCLWILDLALEVKKTSSNQGHWGIWMCCLIAQATIFKCRL